MKRALAFVFTLLVASQSYAAAPGRADHGPLGLGIIVGEPSAITAKYYLDDITAIDAGLAFSFSRWLMIYGDWLYHFQGALARQSSELAQFTPYAGVGGFFALSNLNDVDTRKDKYYSTTSDSRLAIGVRVPVGIEWNPPTIPIGVFLELVPGITVTPATSGFIQGGIGVRYFF